MPDVHLICNQLRGYKETTKQRAIPVKYGGYVGVKQAHRYLTLTWLQQSYLKVEENALKLMQEGPGC